MTDPQILTAAAGTGRHRVEGTAIATGAGAIIALTGGEQPHVGAVGVGMPRPSRRDPGRTSATSSVLTLTGHHDDALAKPLAELAASRLNQPVVVIVGLHVENARESDIARLVEHAHDVAGRLVEQLLAVPGRGLVGGET